MTQPCPVPTAQDPNRVKILKGLAKDKNTNIDEKFVSKAEADVRTKVKQAE